MSLVEAWRRRFVVLMHAVAGVGSYERYVQHLRTHHPGQCVPTRAAFFRERQAARFRKGSRPPCC